MHGVWDRVCALIFLVAFTPAVFAAADYAREQNWADEISPGIVVGDPVQLKAKGREFLGIFTEAENAKAGVVVVHGLGVHPNWALNGVLRSHLADSGYTTLSVQMPVLGAQAKAEEYPPTFPEAAARLEAAVDFLHAKGYKQVAIVSHSMGSRMTNHYLVQNPRAKVAAWVSIGAPELKGVAKLAMPVMDLYGEHDFPQVLKSAKQRKTAIQKLKGSKQVVAPKADHFFTGEDALLVELVKGFLDSTLAGGKTK